MPLNQQLSDAAKSIDWPLVKAAFSSEPKSIKLRRFNPKKSYSIESISDAVSFNYSLSTADQLKPLAFPRDAATIFYHKITTPPCNKFFLGKKIDEDDYEVIFITNEGLVLKKTICFSEAELQRVNVAALFYEKIIGTSKHSILKMLGTNGATYYVVKGQKSDLVGKGNYATVKDALPYPGNFSAPLVIRSFNPIGKNPVPTDIETKNLDGAVARAKGKKFFVHPRHYTVYLKAKFDLTRNLLSKDSFGKIATRCMIANSDIEIWNMAISITRALRYWHLHDIAIRDVKPANILIFPNGDTQITDIDFAEKGASVTTHMKGTPYYLCAELVFSHPDANNFYADVFALKRVLCFPKNVIVYRIKRDIILESKIKRDAISSSEDVLSWIFSDEFIENRNALKWVLDTSDGSAKPHSVDFMLCALLLEKNKLLDCFFSKDTSSVILPDGLIDIIMQYQENDPKVRLLENQEVINLIKRIASLLLESSLPDVFTTHTYELLELLKTKLFPVKQSVDIPLSKSRFTVFSPPSPVLQPEAPGPDFSL